MDESTIVSYLTEAKNHAIGSTCMRRKYGSVIVKDGVIISHGVNNAPIGRKTCQELGYCARMKYNIPRGTRYELCRSIHSELDAILKAGHSFASCDDADLYLIGLEPDGSYVQNPEPCIMCKKAIINAGIRRVYSQVNDYSYVEFDVQDWITNDDTENCEDSYINGGL